MVKPFKLTPMQVDEVWLRWRAGQAVKVLSREMRVHPSTVRRRHPVEQQTRLMPQRDPAPRQSAQEFRPDKPRPP